MVFCKKYSFILGILTESQSETNKDEVMITSNEVMQWSIQGGVLRMLEQAQ